MTIGTPKEGSPSEYEYGSENSRHALRSLKSLPSILPNDFKNEDVCIQDVDGTFRRVTHEGNRSILSMSIDGKFFQAWYDESGKRE